MKLEEIKNPIDQANIIIADYYPDVDMDLAIDFAIQKVWEFINFDVSEPTFVYMDQFEIQHEMSARTYWTLVYKKLNEIKK